MDIAALLCVLEAESEVQMKPLSPKKEKKKTVSICPCLSSVTSRALFAPSGRNKCISRMFCVGLMSVNDLCG